jgi:hypothetical protein
MIQVEKSIVIGRAAEDVLAHVSDRTHAPRWQRVEWSGTMPGQASYVVEPVGMDRARLTSGIEIRAAGLFRLEEPTGSGGPQTRRGGPTSAP